MPPSDLLTAGPAPTYLHPVPRHLGSGNRRNVGCVDNPHSLMLESASTSGAGVLTHRHLYKRLGDFIGRRQLSVAERPHTRLAAGTLGSAASPTLGERSRLALSCSLELGDLLVQLFLGRRQLRNLPLQLRHQPHQLVALRGREVVGLTHSQSIKTCSVPHNPLPTPIPLINYVVSIHPRAPQKTIVGDPSCSFSKVSASSLASSCVSLRWLKISGSTIRLPTGGCR